MRSLDSISFHSRWLGSVILIQIFCHFGRSAYTRFNLSSSWRTLHAALHRKDRQSISQSSRFFEGKVWRISQKDGVFLWSLIHRHPNKALVSLWGVPTGAFDEESKHSRFFEGKASRISQKDGVFLSRHFDRSGEISTNNNCKFFLLNEISRFHFIPLEMTR